MAPSQKSSNRKDGKKPNRRDNRDRADQQIPQNPRRDGIVPTEAALNSIPEHFSSTNTDRDYTLGNPGPSTPIPTRTTSANHKVRPWSFFKVGRVLVIDWVEPHGQSPCETSRRLMSHHSQIRKTAFSEFRWFVVLATYAKHSLALAIHTYNKRAVPPHEPSEHFGFAFTGRAAPTWDQAGISEDVESQMLLPVRVLPDLNTDDLHPTSTMHYRKIYTIEHNVPLGPFGVVHPDYIDRLFAQASTTLRFNLPVPAAEDIATHATTSSAAQVDPARALALRNEYIASIRTFMERMVTQAAARQVEASHILLLEAAVLSLGGPLGQSEDPEAPLRRAALRAAEQFVRQRIEGNDK
ncbi:hypothetical protein AMS68_000215 [Peltaster fructicola]|uniref:DUF6590 domain-containing protein n=1 Tax=Peltaster fructicola TaxID=286661 RepID=A0A6H0XJ81_9PEZI|nr:hypothetical protein AMS68_000215 [Peltaster fructicola]